MALSSSLIAEYGKKISIHLEQGLEVFVAVSGPVIDSVASGIALSESSLSIDWLNQEEDPAWAHL